MAYMVRINFSIQTINIRKHTKVNFKKCVNVNYVKLGTLIKKNGLIYAFRTYTMSL